MTDHDGDRKTDWNTSLAVVLDPTLRIMMSLAVQGISLPVSLSVGGQLVTGNIISGRQFFAAMGADIKQQDEPQEVKAINSMIGLFLDQYPPGHANASEAFDSIQFIHLGDALFLNPTRRVRYWRGNLSHVSGWSYGLSAETDGDGMIRTPPERATPSE